MTEHIIAGVPVRELDLLRLQAWEAIRDASALVIRQVAKDIEQLAGIPLEWYSVLTRLMEAGGAMAQNDLLQRSRFSQSGVSRLIKRMEDERLVERSTSPADRRNMDVAITQLGRDLFGRVTPVYHSSVQENFGAKLNDEQAASVSFLMHQIMDTPPPPTLAHDLEQFLPIGEVLLKVTSDATALREIAEFRDMLEVPLLLDAARAVDRDALNDLREMVTSMSRLIDDPVAFFRADWDLHRKMADCCRNRLLRTLYLRLLDEVATHLDGVVPTGNLKLYLYERLAIHARIVDALSCGDIDLIKSAAEAHSYSASRLYAAALKGTDRLEMDA